MPFSDGKAFISRGFVFPLAYILIIPQVRAFVKTFFYFFLEGLSFRFPCPLYTLIIPQIVSVVKEFFLVSEIFFIGSPVESRKRFLFLGAPPLDTYYYSRWDSKSQY